MDWTMPDEGSMITIECHTHPNTMGCDCKKFVLRQLNNCTKYRAALIDLEAGLGTRRSTITVYAQFRAILKRYEIDPAELDPPKGEQ